MLLWLTSVLCARLCGDRATAETMRGAWWRQSAALQPGPHFVVVVAVWSCVLALMSLVSGILVGACALAMHSSPSWPDAHVWAPVALLPLMCALVLVCLLGVECAGLAVHRWRFQNALKPMTLVAMDTLRCECCCVPVAWLTARLQPADQCTAGRRRR